MNRLKAKEGLFVVHLFFSIDHWKRKGGHFHPDFEVEVGSIVDRIKNEEGFQIATFCMLCHCDIGFMILGPDLHKMQEFEKRLTKTFSLDGWNLHYSFFSMTEKSEYTTTRAEFEEELISSGIQPGTEDFLNRMSAFEKTMEYYTTVRLYPTLPNYPFFSFYPMRKKRESSQNWYALGFKERKELMKGHAIVGRKYSGRVVQYITGSTGLDDWEWAVSLYANDPYDIKSIVYEMRFDPVSAKFAEFGSFYCGLQMSLNEAIKRVQR
ncbi:heme peroxidase [Candidatus Methylacidiphilum fumarolicum]|uniref:Predicted heme peroxidase involved in anaerobic stress response n=2 Tax=Candidatus Methylacidiphilum fumarolicum TaxID=591154 RepID=I0JWV4_METFB|nr:chlorite dismutase family protein [Candidatus Methylacidiphilum fumarolicum]MBW6414418.1 chlorite dismutase family protein [Candidatus Methylacidiphilum fumarolicum]TFE69421.1 heme peroxidase [Candidatus Methylacidiphilum fumarolicum]TFE72873.1 heme peroxidase [Candidatus Methylacidiphilum fumarolicum]TFE74616.1 heme peroxidase [Candidatus Methylacidiphilum fumarolicum]TFE77183.1 heme peroxidase [Candidatus Methylacidiphilum fumarolicum]